MSLWSLRLGVLCCLIISAVLAIHTNDTIKNQIPEWYSKLAEGNSLWYDLLHNCKNSSFSCIKRSSYNYLNNLLTYPDNVQLTESILLQKNDVDFADTDQTSDNDTSVEETGRSSSPIEDMTDALHNQAVKFLMTHDVVVKLPEMFFDGAYLKVSPRSFDQNGTLIKLDTYQGEGRILFKKIKKFISKKLIIALLAILLVVKLIAVKLLFFMPMVVGAAAAKKLLLKILLFFFPVLAHFFKLCPYYQPAKFHHHQHHISHIHHLKHLPSLHHSVELDHPPPGHSSDDHVFDYYSEGPGVAGHDYHRKDDAKTKLGDHYTGSFGGQGQNVYKRGTKHPPSGKRPFTPTEIENMILKAEKEATLKARLQEEQKRVEVDNKKLQDHIKQLLKIQEKLKIQQVILKERSKLTAAHILQNANIIPSQTLSPPQNVIAGPMIPPAIIQPSAIQGLPVYSATYKQEVQATTPQSSYDPFYSPILDKIDKVLNDVGYTDEACRERLICSMYKNPPKFSPYSNLVSAELSRDSSDLEKPTSSNVAVIRFYKYVQAARDGQDKRDCLRLYPACVINTET